MNSPQLAIVLGTRPEIVKLAPIIRECRDRDVPHIVVHTGQHYSPQLTEVFFDELELPPPDHALGVGSATHGEQTGSMIAGIEEVLLEADPETVLVQGDTNTTLAATIAASKLDAELGHVEAGLRSDDRGMPEEVNRIICDHTADRLFAPTPAAAENLRAEGVPSDRISVTGNTVVDALQRHRGLAADRTAVLDDLGVEPGEYGLLTLHRAENVDDPDRFADLLTGVGRVAREYEMDVVYPAHPRARKKLEDLRVPNAVEVVEPLDYLEFLRLESDASVILTDSGGVQEEACVLGVPCVTLRENTERPETIAAGANRLGGVTPTGIFETAREMVGTDAEWENPFGDGDAAARILDAAAATDADGADDSAAATEAVQ
ncbi:UDP-N-acetylglucosamine 2-epimerase (non-hydrolyzing) (plasmid) [Halorussus limi]|uniref:UDP-N-acetylglucosamine 2-epimerase (Non-hydrolyzing) n=1 Tax=Halorussus limi TaxID=2938695 RepID=A0A8U0I0R6_9EURY|nr:UDP-N-acetylglucosamine 2-epimerase (non-hydrolyzing) [Halorussus limi]UPV76860.1 UDP-N-acetylglucosamine 2-epimerase (non-hydrolyzing) [Halorussus limi]